MFNCLLDCYSIQMNGTNCVNLSSYRYCTFLEWVHVHVLFIMMYKEVLTFGSLNEILECNYSIESYCTVLSCAGTVYYAVQVGYNI